MNFREYYSLLELDELIEQAQTKPWKAKRADVIRFWSSLRPNQPIQPTPVSKFHTGTKFREDGLRITGSPDFINGVLSRIKDLLQYDTNVGTSLEVEYRELQSKEGEPTAQPVYVCYLHVIQKDNQKNKKMF